jgi:predicted ATP-binding protein involved in virulence
MKILEFRCTNVHGYLSFALMFRRDLSFITGINGSGKTSSVRALTALLTPSIRDLANMAYQSVQVRVEHDDADWTISSRRTDEELTIECTGVEDVLRIPVLRAEAYEPRTRFLEREHDFYREQEAVNVRNPVLVAIEKLPTPMFLDLERRHQAGTRRRRDEHRFIGRAGPANPLAGSLLDSLTDAQGLAEDNYRQLLATRSQLTDQLKQDIILTAFEPNDEGVMSQAPLIPPRSFLRQIARNENVVHASLSQIGISEERIAAIVQPFFSRVRDVASRLPSDKKLRGIASAPIEIDKVMIQNLQDWSALQPQVQQIN